MENTELIEEMMRDAEQAAEPGELHRAQVVSHGDEEAPPMVASELKSAGYVYIYDRKSGERSICNRNNLTRALKKMRDGEYIFTTVKPKVAPKRGTLKCLLHPDDPNRAHYDELGFATCRKANLTSPFQVNRHMQKRHKQEWAAIQEERQLAKEQRDREFQERLLSQATGMPLREFKKNK